MQRSRRRGLLLHEKNRRVPLEFSSIDTSCFRLQESRRCKQDSSTACFVLVWSIGTLIGGFDSSDNVRKYSITVFLSVCFDKIFYNYLNCIDMSIILNYSIVSSLNGVPLCINHQTSLSFTLEFVGTSKTPRCLFLTSSSSLLTPIFNTIRYYYFLPPFCRESK